MIEHVTIGDQIGQLRAYVEGRHSGYYVTETRFAIRSWYERPPDVQPDSVETVQTRLEVECEVTARSAHPKQPSIRCILAIDSNGNPVVISEEFVFYQV